MSNSCLSKLELEAHFKRELAHERVEHLKYCTYCQLNAQELMRYARDKGSTRKQRSTYPWMSSSLLLGIAAASIYSALSLYSNVQHYLGSSDSHFFETTLSTTQLIEELINPTTSDYDASAPSQGLLIAAVESYLSGTLEHSTLLYRQALLELEDEEIRTRAHYELGVTYLMLEEHISAKECFHNARFGSGDYSQHATWALANTSFIETDTLATRKYCTQLTAHQNKTYTDRADSLLGKL